jgi:NAD+ kinase
MIQQVAIVYKAHTPAAEQEANRLSAWLEQKGVTSYQREAGAAQPHTGPGPEIPDMEPCDLAVVLGGDGTMLGAVRALVGAGLERAPILGVNLGGLGFLTALSPEEMLPAMQRVLGGEFTTLPRMLLAAKVTRDQKVVRRYLALNDMVINKAALARIIELAIMVNGEPLTTFRADGLIFSTPTGSTAYNLSAGGPICQPDLECIVLTPICSFALTNRPLALSPQAVISFRLSRRALDTTLTCDGQVGIELIPGDEVSIKKAQRSVHIIQSPFKDYFDVLRNKLHWG